MAPQEQPESRKKNIAWLIWFAGFRFYVGLFDGNMTQVGKSEKTEATLTFLPAALSFVALF